MKQHIDRHYDEDLLQLRERVLAMGARVERMIGGTIRALFEGDREQAREMVALDTEVDRDENEIDEMSIRLLASRQPVATDLRFITLCMKIVTDLERMGDLAVNIGERVMDLVGEDMVRPLNRISRISEIAQDMVRQALDALVDHDAEKARAVLGMDDRVDEQYVDMFEEFFRYVQEDPASVKRSVAFLFVARYLERIADHATNVAEMVIFWVQGKDVRHRAITAS